MQRKLYSLMVWLDPSKRLGAVVNLPDNSGGCVRLINSRRTWLTAKAGDAVLLTRDEQSERHFIASIEVFRADPASEVGRVITTAEDWLNNGG